MFFCLALTAAIYLAKRNIRKKGMLEPYEQVCDERNVCQSKESVVFFTNRLYLCFLNRPITITSINGLTTSGTLL